MTTPRQVTIEPLGPAAFAPFGDVIMAERSDVRGKPANLGTAMRYDRLADLRDLRRGSAKLNLSVFRCTPRLAWPMVVTMLEKHPGSTQVFVPMNAARYLVIVASRAREGDGPDLATLRAFLATGRQGVAYGPGTWHHPIVALDHETDFACLVHENGSDGDCVVARFDAVEQPLVLAPS